MTRDEYYNSTEFKLVRLLQNYPANIQQDLQKMGDLIEIIAERHTDIATYDKFSLMTQQLRIALMDINTLFSHTSAFCSLLRPKLEDDPI